MNNATEMTDRKTQVLPVFQYTLTQQEGYNINEGYISMTPPMIIFKLWEKQ